MAYIPHWRGEADVVTGKVCKATGLCLFLFEGDGGTNLERSRTGSRTITNDFAPNPHTACQCLEIDYILSSLALLCVLYTFPKLIVWDLGRQT